MSDATAVWRPTGVGWSQGVTRLEWLGPGEVVRSSSLELGGELAFVFGADRRCVGFWRSGRRLRCSTATVLAATGRSPQCPDCQGLERSNSIAADTRLDDPRSFSVYLAHHGSVVKVGITATERGDARLLEQGALASTIISTGSLLGARRIENLLMTALSLPDRVGTTRKRAARTRPGTIADRAATLRAVADDAAQLPWPEGQNRCETEVQDHTATYGLPAQGVQPDAAVRAPVPGGVLVGRIACTIGTDVYLQTAAGLVLLDTRLLAGWALDRAPQDATFSVPLERIDPEPHQEEQDALF